MYQNVNGPVYWTTYTLSHLPVYVKPTETPTVPLMESINDILNIKSIYLYLESFKSPLFKYKHFIPLPSDYVFIYVWNSFN